MFDNLGWPEILAMLLIALFVLGPERLPKLLKDAGNLLRRVRRMASDATSDLNRDLGTDLDVTDLNPKAFLRKHILSEEDEAALKKPLQAAFEDLKKDTEGVRGTLRDTASTITSKPGAAGAGAAGAAGASAKPVNGTPVTEPVRRSFDSDAT